MLKYLHLMPLGGNNYACAECKDAGLAHSVDSVSAGRSDRTCLWGANLPMIKYVCSCCKTESGPYISTKYTGDGW